MHRAQRAEADHDRPRQKREEIALRAAFHFCPHRLAAGAHAGDVEESNSGILARQRAGPTHREVVREVRILRLAHSVRGHAEAEEAGVVAAQLLRTDIEIEHVWADEIAQLRMRSAGMLAADRKNGLDVGVEEASTKDALPHHTRRAEENDFHSGFLPNPDDENVSGCVHAAVVPAPVSSANSARGFQPYATSMRTPSGRVSSLSATTW